MVATIIGSILLEAKVLLELITRSLICFLAS